MAEKKKNNCEKIVGHEWEKTGSQEVYGWEDLQQEEVGS